MPPLRADKKATLVICTGIIAIGVFISFINGDSVAIRDSSDDGSDSLAEMEGDSSDIIGTQAVSLKAQSPDPVPIEQIDAVVTAYTTSEAEQTDCISASGKNLCYRHDERENLAACPERYQFMTIVEIEKTQYTCVDLMAQRFRDQNRFDIYLGHEGREPALEYGTHYTKAKIFPPKED